MKFLRRLFTRAQPQTFPAPAVDVLIARRAVRLHNRSAKGASAYERIHSILAVRRG
jgi:hypothetical protein